MSERRIPDDDNPQPPDAAMLIREIATNPWVASIGPTHLTFKDGMPFDDWLAIGRLLVRLDRTLRSGEGGR